MHKLRNLLLAGLLLFVASSPLAVFVGCDDDETEIEYDNDHEREVEYDNGEVEYDDGEVEYDD
jgi:hypothetical protein